MDVQEKVMTDQLSIQIKVDSSQIAGLGDEIESLLAEFEPHSLELVRKRIDSLLGGEDLLVVEQRDSSAGAFELCVLVRPSDSFSSFLAALRAGDVDRIAADIEH